jgi:hypothetical protein
MTDHVVPGFHRRKEKGEKFFNTLLSVEHNYQETGSGWHIKAKAFHLCGDSKVYTETKWDGPVISQGIGLRNGTTNSIDGGNLISDSDIALLSTEVSTSVLSRRGRSDANLFESLAEMDQTLDQLLNKFQQIRKTVGALTKGRVGASPNKTPKGSGMGWRSSAQSSSNEYLGYRYGLLPLLRDVESIMKGIEAKVGKREVTTRAQDRIESNAQSTFTLGFGSATVATTILLQQHDVVTVRGMSLDEFVADLSFNLGFSAKGLITLPLELVSHSFVADWFLNIGDVFGAAVPSLSFNQLGSCLVTRRETTTIWTAEDSVASSGYDLIRGTTGSFVNTRRQIVRGPLSAPGLVIKNDFRFDKLTRVADAAALLAQQFLRLSNKTSR